jgi:23S rRNA pseudouridine1911/1915/1917 synthase
VHLAEGGNPLVGENVYVREHAGPRIAAARPMLHAAELGFDHPSNGRPMRFSDPPPADFAALLASLRR